MVRCIVENDREEFIKMMTEFFSTPAVLHGLPESNFVATFNECVGNSPYAKAFIVEQNGEIAGYLQIVFSYSNEVAGMVVWIEELYVREKFRGCGLAKELLDFLRKEYDATAKRYRLEVSPHNTEVMSLYEKLGFNVLEYIQMNIDL